MPLDMIGERLLRAFGASACRTNFLESPSERPLVQDSQTHCEQMRLARVLRSGLCPGVSELNSLQTYRPEGQSGTTL